MIDKEKTTVTMSLKDYEKLQYDINFYKERCQEITNGKYINANVEYKQKDGQEIEYYKVEFDIYEFIKDNYYYFHDDDEILEHIYSLEEMDELTLICKDSKIFIKDGEIIGVGGEIKSDKENDKK